MERYSSEIPDLKEYSGSWAWGCCPFHDDHTPSFCVNLDSGGFKCHSSSCGVSGNGIVSFVSQLYDITLAEAVARIRKEYIHE